MDLLRGDMRALYRRYFLAAFGSVLISCIYGVVDMAMVGQYQGPDGTAALAVVAPVWNVIYSLGLLTGIGGSVLLSAKRGSGAAGQAEANEYFTTAVLASVLLAALAWAGIWLLEKPILRYLGADALAIYGPVINISTFVQCCAYSVGQAAQPIIPTNFGAHQGARIRAVLRLALVSCVSFSVFWTALSLAWPNLYIRIFMRPTAAILTMAPGIVRTYAVSFLLLPAVLGPTSIWWAMPVTELLVACYAVTAMRRATRALPPC